MSSTGRSENDEPSDPLRYDFYGSLGFDLARPTAGGYRQVLLKAETIDVHAEEFLGKHQCHRLAAALCRQ